VVVADEDVVGRVMDSAVLARTGVLNFASPVRPGGGWQYGNAAQEESLCRASFLSWELERFDAEYYQVNRMFGMGGMYLPHFIYSHDVKFLKRPVDGREVMVDPVWADVVTMAAPNRRLNDGSYGDADYEADVAYKMRQTLRAFAKNGCRSIVLGAFGCGVFGNDPGMVARSWFDTLRSDEFACAFETVYFSVYGGRGNIRPFVDALGGRVESGCWVGRV
jgi:uncharacterized protein (TIGR02452 family)